MCLTHKFNKSRNRFASAKIAGKVLFILSMNRGVGISISQSDHLPSKWCHAEVHVIDPYPLSNHRACLEILPGLTTSYERRL